jgi:hypothetical protein
MNPAATRLNRTLKDLMSTMKGADMRKFTPCLWFDDNAEEAAKFYTSIFKIRRLRALPIMEMGSKASEGRRDR